MAADRDSPGSSAFAASERGDWPLLALFPALMPAVSIERAALRADGGRFASLRRFRRSAKWPEASEARAPRHRPLRQDFRGGRSGPDME